MLIKDKKEKTICIRLTQEEYNKIKLKSNLYSEGNTSNWMRIASIDFKPTNKHLKGERVLNP